MITQNRYDKRFYKKQYVGGGVGSVFKNGLTIVRGKLKNLLGKLSRFGKNKFEQVVFPFLRNKLADLVEDVANKGPDYIMAKTDEFISDVKTNNRNTAVSNVIKNIKNDAKKETKKRGNKFILDSKKLAKAQTTDPSAILSNIIAGNGLKMYKGNGMKLL